VERGSENGRGNGEDPGGTPSRTTLYSMIVGIAFVVLIVIAGVNTLRNDHGGVLGASDEGDEPLAQFAIPNARLGTSGDANIAQDDCEDPRIPCPEGSRRTPACEVDVPGAIRVCDLFSRPLVLSFWFTRGGDCPDQEDVFEKVYRRYRDRVNFLAIDVHDSADKVKSLIEEHRWTHPVGLDRDGALSNIYRVGGCPTFIYAYPGGISQSTSIGELDEAQLANHVDQLLEDTRVREETLN
jgi:thiol-disulfide isomerase/thioredoxin